MRLAKRRREVELDHLGTRVLLISWLRKEEEPRVGVAGKHIDDREGDEGAPALEACDSLALGLEERQHALDAELTDRTVGHLQRLLDEPIHR
eukprot:scaffold32292_cov71-Phaeocystis_antarctica.AAC.5